MSGIYLGSHLSEIADVIADIHKGDAPVTLKASLYLEEMKAKYGSDIHLHIDKEDGIDLICAKGKSCVVNETDVLLSSKSIRAEAVFSVETIYRESENKNANP